ncbi:hypothetical protein CROQUDRAFT_66263 [Cronartium quercuum f. sp. fusiforme G11]|uniref:histone acetyltransferase n=1 Tax=Cronartium quercuum f. sp. fusiforme G11 TaxID=708437 RepID=A0A9P6NG61_9BASI|nr:hypothetical protein CROQUDRAFT_66263 [Cronartium quercuum f. sp. fusiforme G11]
MEEGDNESKKVVDLAPNGSKTPRKRKRMTQDDQTVAQTGDNPQGPVGKKGNGKEATSSSNISTHQQIKLVQIDTVIFGAYEIRPWYSSPYMLDDPDSFDLDGSTINLHQRPVTNLAGIKRLGNGRFIKKKKSKVKETGSSLLPQSTITSYSGPQVSSNEDETRSNGQLTDRRRGARQRSESLSSLSSSLTSGDHPKLHQSIQYSSTLNQPDGSKSNTPKKPKRKQITSTLLGSNCNEGQAATSTPIKLFVCDGCFQYLLSSESYLKHKKLCQYKHPPGRKVYQRGAHIIWEVDGSEAKLYCQCLSLFGKLFIDHKYIFFDVEGFYFYVLTEAITPAFDHVLGFFSKEKISYDGYNLACIVTFPPYQKKGYGTLLIEFSYELDRHQAEQEDRLVLGTPERPLSESGARGYLAYWTAVLVRYFRRLLEGERSKKRQQGECDETLLTTRDGTPKETTAFQASSSDPPILIEMSLEEISRETQLRPDDAAFALFTSGFTQTKTQSPKWSEIVVITPELVEEVAQRTRTKRAVLDRQYVLLNSLSS